MLKKIITSLSILLVIIFWMQNVHAGCYGEYEGKLESNTPPCLNILIDRCFEGVEIENKCNVDYKVFDLENCKPGNGRILDSEKEALKLILKDNYFNILSGDTFYFPYPSWLDFGKIKIQYLSKTAHQIGIFCNSKNTNTKEFNFIFEDENKNIYNASGIYRYEKLEFKSSKPIMKSGTVFLVATFVFISSVLYFIFKFIKSFIKKK